MLNVFEGRKVYDEGGWKVTNERSFTPEELAQVKSAEVVESDFGTSMCFCMVSGGKIYIPMSRNTHLGIGDIPILENLIILTLERKGQVITRIE